MSREFEVPYEADLPASPEDVWKAITADTAAWQFPGMPLPPEGERPGPPVSEWDPPHHFAIYMQMPEDTYNSLDYLIEAREGGTAHIRYVHSGILSDEWADQYDAIGPHTAFYFHTLGQYLEHFNGRPVTYVGQVSFGINGPETAGGADAMDTLAAALGLGAGAKVGDAVHATLGDAGDLDGVIDYVTPQFLGVRTADSLYRFFGRNHFGGVVGMSAHRFADGVDAAAEEQALQNWLNSVFA